MENGTVKRSKGSMTLMTYYRFPHHGNRFFAVAQNDALPWVLLYRQAWKWLESQLCRLFNVILNEGKNTLWERRETERWNGVKNLLPGWHLTASPTTSTDFSHGSGRHTAMSSTFTGKRKRSRHHQQCLLLSFWKFLTSWQRELLPGPSIHPAPISSLYFPPASCHFSLSSP